MLSRFVNESHQKKVIQGLCKGTVDLVIGTHRLLSEDITYKDLGLLVIDEEQRFGVKHKEKLKMARQTVDVLTCKMRARTLETIVIRVNCEMLCVVS